MDELATKKSENAKSFCSALKNSILGLSEDQLISNFREKFVLDGQSNIFEKVNAFEEELILKSNLSDISKKYHLSKKTDLKPSSLTLPARNSSFASFPNRTLQKGEPSFYQLIKGDLTKTFHPLLIQ